MKLKIITAALVLLSFTAPLRSDDATTEDAQKALQEKQAARDKARAAVVTITAGELEDLKNQVASLQGQVAYLKEQLATRTPSAVKQHDQIELGMTKDEVTAFVKSQGSKMSVIGISATNGVRKSQSTVTVSDTGDTRVTDSGQATISANGQATLRHGAEGANLAGTGKTRAVSTNSNATVNDSGRTQVSSTGTRTSTVTVNNGRQEVMEIARWTTVRKVVSVHQGGFGQVDTDYASVPERCGTVRVTFTDDIVSSVEDH